MLQHVLPVGMTPQGCACLFGHMFYYGDVTNRELLNLRDALQWPEAVEAIVAQTGLSKEQVSQLVREWTCSIRSMN